MYYWCRIWLGVHFGLGGGPNLPPRQQMWPFFSGFPACNVIERASYGQFQLLEVARILHLLLSTDLTPICFYRCKIRSRCKIGPMHGIVGYALSQSRSRRNIQCWAVLTFSVRTFKVFSPVLRMRSGGFHIN
jgi:hypothetical protein